MRRALRTCVIPACAVLLLAFTPATAGKRIDVSERSRSRAAKEVRRGDHDAGKDKPRAALLHYLAALELDPYNAEARAGLDALTGSRAGGGRTEPCAGGSAGSAGRGGGVVPRPFANFEGKILGRVPGTPEGPIRPDGPHYAGARPFLGMVEESAASHGVDPRLVLAVMKAESNFNPKARSKSGARGLMQLMPATAARFGARAIDDPAQNIDAGTRYLRYLLELFKGDLDRALGAYVAGEMTVVKSGGVPSAGRVQSYVRRVRHYAYEF